MLWNSPDYLPVGTSRNAVLSVRRRARDQLVALDDVTGTPLWTTEAPVGDSTGIRGGDNVIVIQEGDVVTGLDPSTGRTMWKWSLPN